MPRRYRRRARYAIARPLKTAKYSNETFAFTSSFTNPGTTVGSHSVKNIQIVPQTGVLGTRKVKNITLRFMLNASQYYTDATQTWTQLKGQLVFCVVYVPEGTDPSPPNFGSDVCASLYEPNQNVIMSGLVDDNQTYTIKTRLARNLNSNDRMYLVVQDMNGPTAMNDRVTTSFAAIINYAISF